MENSIVVKSESNDLFDYTCIKKYNLNGLSSDAKTLASFNKILVYLEEYKTYYIRLNFGESEISAYHLSINKVSSSEYDFFDYNESNVVLQSIQSNDFDYFNKIFIEQSTCLKIDFIISANSINSLKYVILSYEYSEQYEEYILTVKEINDIITVNSTITIDLNDGIYYIGFIDNQYAYNISMSLSRIINDYESEHLQVDPYGLEYSGSQKNIVENSIYFPSRLYDYNVILKGFTRVIYVDDELNNPSSRFNYSWYSSNESVAMITEYGTILGLIPGSVKIMAVDKSDHSIVYIKEFVIVDNDDSAQRIIEIYDTRESYNDYFAIGLTAQNCPYPLFQYYYWSVDIIDGDSIVMFDLNDWGNIIFIGTGTVCLIGNYYYNENYIIKYYLTVESV